MDLLLFSKQHLRTRRILICAAIIRLRSLFEGAEIPRKGHSIEPSVQLRNCLQG